MNIIADTNLLVRLIVPDHPAQTRMAVATLEQAETITVSLHVLCELVWVLRRLYGVAHSDIAAAIRNLLETHNLETDLPGVDAGLSMLDIGGDFADGVIAYDGLRLGGETFVSFDRKAVSVLTKQGYSAKLLVTRS